MVLWEIMDSESGVTVITAYFPSDFFGSVGGETEKYISM